MEKDLEGNLWLGGEAPSKADKDMLESVEGLDISAKVYPNVFAWHNLIGEYSGERLESMPVPQEEKETQPK